MSQNFFSCIINKGKNIQFETTEIDTYNKIVTDFCQYMGNKR